MCGLWATDVSSTDLSPEKLSNAHRPLGDSTDLECFFYPSGCRRAFSQRKIPRTPIVPWGTALTWNVFSTLRAAAGSSPREKSPEQPSSPRGRACFFTNVVLRRRKRKPARTIRLRAGLPLALFTYTLVRSLIPQITVTVSSTWISSGLKSIPWKISSPPMFLFSIPTGSL